MRKLPDAKWVAFVEENFDSSATIVLHVGPSVVNSSKAVSEIRNEITVVAQRRLQQDSISSPTHPVWRGALRIILFVGHGRTFLLSLPLPLCDRHGGLVAKASAS